MPSESILMKDEITTRSKYKFHPLKKHRWKDFENLFGKRGACGGCWCMYWRIRRKEFEQKKGEGNKREMKKLVSSGKIPGLIAYDGAEPVGWCSVAPRDEFSVLQNSRILKRVDEKLVWSVVCFFIKKEYRNKGLSVELLIASKKYVKMNGCKIVEGYPIEPKKSPMPDAFAWVGFSSAFQEAGFKEVVRRSESRPVMRYYIK